MSVPCPCYQSKHTTRNSCVRPILVVLAIAAFSSCSQTPDAPTNPAAPKFRAPIQPTHFPIREPEPQFSATNGYKQIAHQFSDGADNLGNPAYFKDRVATTWMKIKGIGTEEDFARFLVGLMDRSQSPAADKTEEADRLVAQGQLQFSLAMAAGANGDLRSNLHRVSDKLTRLFPPAKVAEPTVEPSTPVPAAKDTVEIPAPVQAEPKPSPPAPQTPNFAALLANSKYLIKAKVYPPAQKNLQRIVDEAPGTPEAAEAQQLLDSIPK
jgi:hypothetical protein